MFVFLRITETPAILSLEAKALHSKSAELPRVCSRGGACPMPKYKTERKPRNISSLPRIPNEPWQHKCNYPSAKQKVNLLCVDHFPLKAALFFQTPRASVCKGYCPEIINGCHKHILVTDSQICAHTNHPPRWTLGQNVTSM